MRSQMNLRHASGSAGISGVTNRFDSTQLTALRHALLELHQALIEHERRAYEKVNGRQSGADFLQLLAYDPAYRWLSPLSAVIVALDEADEAAQDHVTDPAAV